MNRNYLARALRLGLRELSIMDDKTALACVDDRKQYVFMPLDPESAIPPAKDAIRIVSPGTNPEIPVTQSQTRRRVSTVPEPVTNPNGNATSNGNGEANRHAKTNGRAKLNGATRKPNHQDIDNLIRQVETLRQAQRDVFTKTHELLKGLKRHRRQSRVFQTTIASLRQLKTLGV
jgi:hypothetical protein